MERIEVETNTKDTGKQSRRKSRTPKKSKSKSSQSSGRRSILDFFEGNSKKGSKSKPSAKSPEPKVKSLISSKRRRRQKVMMASDSESPETKKNSTNGKAKSPKNSKSKKAKRGTPIEEEISHEKPNINFKGDFRDVDLPDYLTSIEESYKLTDLTKTICSKTDLDILSKCFETKGPFSEPMPFFAISETLESVSTQKGKGSADNKKEFLVSLISETIRQSPSEVHCLFNVLTCRFDADFKQNEVNIGQETLVKVVSKMSGKGIKQIRGELRKKGGLGIVAAENRSGQKRIGNFFQAKKIKQKNLKVTLNYWFRMLKSLGDIRKIILFYIYEIGC